MSGNIVNVGFGMSQKRRRIKNMDACENQMFVEILKTAEDGKMWKIINQGTAKRQDSHNVWIKAADIFTKETGKEMDWKQAKSKWNRIKSDAKKKNDQAKIQKEFRKQCSLTGGGVPPSLPDQEDGDDFDMDLQLNDFEPTVRDYNGLFQPEDKIES